MCQISENEKTWTDSYTLNQMTIRSFLPLKNFYKISDLYITQLSVNSASSLTGRRYCVTNLSKRRKKPLMIAVLTVKGNTKQY